MHRRMTSPVRKQQKMKVDASEASDAIEPDEDMPDKSSENPGSEWRSVVSDSTARVQNDYHVYTHEFDVVVRPAELCEPDELLRPARCS